MNRPQQLTLAIGLALGSSSAWSLGLGTIEVRSGLNEPLVAEIPVTLSNPKEADGLRATIATAEDFRRVGLDPISVPRNLNVSVSKNAKGQPVIRVTSADPFNEPMTSLLLDVNWGSGRMLREYTVLLDPPDVAPAIIGSSAVTAPVREDRPSEQPALTSEPVREPEPVRVPEPETAAPPPVVETAPEPVVERAPEPTPEPERTPEPPPTLAAPSEPAPQPEPRESQPVAVASSEYGPVAAGETLWEIANNTRPSDAVAVNQMMLALLRANPNAFYDNNVNTLKRGAILRVPSELEAQSLSVSQALAEVNAQTRAWRAANTPVTVASESTAAPSTPSRPSAPRPSSASNAGSRLEIVPPSGGSAANASTDRPGTKGGTGDAALRAELQRAKEALASSEQDVSELRARVKELESIKADDAKLIALKNDQLAALQARVAELEQTTAAAAVASTTAAPAVTPSDTTVVAATDPATTPTDTTTPPVDAATTPTETPGDATTEAPVEVNPIAEEAPAEAAPPSDESAAMPWWRDMKLVGGAAGGLLGLGGLLWWLSRRKKAPAAPAEAASNGNSRLADAFSGGALGAGAAATGGLAEDSALLNRLAEDPTNLDTHLDLLSLYYRSQDVEGFEAAAEAMYAQVGNPDDSRWQQALSMGRALIPDHPMFAADDTAADFELPAADATSTSAAKDFDFDSLFEQPAAKPKAPEPDRTLEVPMPEMKTAPLPPAPKAEFDFDFKTAPAPIIKSEPLPAAPKEDLAPLDFDWEKPAEPAKEAAKPAPPPLADVPVTEQAPAFAPYNASDDAVATKLDLARAYLDMGDPEGARSMLEEVMAEGNANQREEASRLLGEIR